MEILESLDDYGYALRTTEGEEVHNAYTELRKRGGHLRFEANSLAASSRESFPGI
jgi:hypothetical protein